MQRWEQVDLSKVKVPGVNFDVSGSAFVSATFRVGESVYRIRRQDYSTVVEKFAPEIKKTYVVKFEKGEFQHRSIELECKKEAEDFAEKMDAQGFLTEIVENETPIQSTVNFDVLPF